MQILCTILNLYLIALFARIILSWFPMEPGTAMASIYQFLFSITEPVLGPLRRVIPPGRGRRLPTGPVADHRPDRHPDHPERRPRLLSRATPSRSGSPWSRKGFGTLQGWTSRRSS